MTRSFQAPNAAPVNSTYESIFLAGGITGCHDWQTGVVERLLAETTDTMIFNPRRVAWDMLDKAETERQIRWEHHHLESADAVLFWFAPESIQPITLLEYGLHLREYRPLFVGVHPDYERSADLHLQTKLYRTAQTVHTSLDDLLAEVIKYLNGANYARSA